MTTTTDRIARAAAQLREAARDVARVADLRNRQSEPFPRSAEHGRSEADVAAATKAIRRAVICRVTKVGMASGTEAYGQSAGISHVEPT